MSEKDSIKNIELIKQIPEFQFGEPQLEEASMAGAMSGFLGGDFFPDNPPVEVPRTLEEHETRTLEEYEKWRANKWQPWRSWLDQFKEQLDEWQSQHSWLPRYNAKNYDHFARSFFYNPQGRKFVEELDPQAGRNLVQKLDANKSGMHIQWMLTVPATAEAVQDRFQGDETLTNFSLSLLRYLVPNNELRERRLEAGAPDSVDGDAARQFWTVAPYIYDNLVKSGLKEEDALDALFDWGAARKKPEYSSGVGHNADFPGTSNLREISLGDEVGWYLSNNPSDASHQLAREVGAHIASQIAPFYKK